MNAATADVDWHRRARELRPQGRAFIDGRGTDALSGETFDCLSPIDGRLLARVAACDAADVDIAVALRDAGAVGVDVTAETWLE